MKIEKKWQVLMIVCVGIFMATLDGSILNIANPTIAKDFSVPMSSIQWVVTSYMLVITSTLIFFGKLGDKIGNYKVYANGFLIFTLGSFFCSISPTLYFLVTSRIIQAFGASMLMANGMGIVSNAFPANERGKALGLTGSMVGIGNMAGPSLGGFLVAGFGWPVIFLINIPLGIAGYYFAIRYLPRLAVQKDKAPFDYIGTLLFAFFAILLIISLSKSNQINFALLFIAIVLFFLFLKYEKKISFPMIDFNLFKIKAFVYGNILGVFAYTSQTFITFLVPFYLERLLLYSPALSGLLMTIPPVTMAIIAPIAGSLSDKYGSEKLLSIGFFALFSAHLLCTRLDANVSIYYLIFALFLAGIGMGLFGSPNNNSIMGSVPPQKVGYTGGFISTVRNFCFSLGIAVSTGTFTYMLALNENSLGFALAYSKANQIVYLIPAGLTLAGLIISLTMLNRRNKDNNSISP